MHRQEAAPVEDQLDDLVDIIRFAGIRGNDGVQPFFRPVWIVTDFTLWRFFPVTARQVADQLAGQIKRIGLILSSKVGHTADRIVHHGAAEVIQADLLSGDSLDHLGAGDEHMAGTLGHDNEVGQAGRVNRATGAGSDHHADLRDHAAGLGVAPE